MSRGFSFVIPAYNEAKRLPATLSAISKLCGSRLGPCEIIVIDDGSTDFTLEAARNFEAADCEIRVFRIPHRGKGFAIRHGVGVARGETIVLCDADMHDSVSEVFFLEQALKRGADVAIGSRWLVRFDYRHSQPLYRKVLSRIYNMLATRMFSMPFGDTQCGLKALSRHAAARIFPMLNLDGWGYDIELIHVARAHGLVVEEVGLRIIHDYRDSRFRPLSDGWITFLELAKVRWYDMRGAYRPPEPTATERRAA
jgi:glycosyltransferase involved in cell wall biosynthesis